MGIKVIGDVILILKHSKAVAGKMQTDKALASGTSLSSSAATKRSTSVVVATVASKSVAGDKKSVIVKPSSTAVRLFRSLHF